MDDLNFDPNSDSESSELRFGRFTESSIRSLMLAQAEAKRLGHTYVGTEWLLLGIMGEGGVAAKAIKAVDVNLSQILAEIEKATGRGIGYTDTQLPFTPRAKRVLQLSWDEAKKLSHERIDTGHILLGLLQEGTGLAVRVLDNLGVDLQKLRDSVLAEQQNNPTLQFSPEEDR
jgi:ATP-dependent Clp protease ATP-binding subunit ClpC